MAFGADVPVGGQEWGLGSVFLEAREKTAGGRAAVSSAEAQQKPNSEPISEALTRLGPQGAVSSWSWSRPPCLDTLFSL